MSSTYRDPDMQKCEVETNQYDTRVEAVWVRHHWHLSMYVSHILTSCKIRQQKLPPLNLLPTEIVNLMFEHNQYIIAKLASRMPGAVTRQIGLQLTYFLLQGLEIVRNVSCHAQLEDQYGFWQRFPINVNTSILESGHFGLRPFQFVDMGHIIWINTPNTFKFLCKLVLHSF